MTYLTEPFSQKRMLSLRFLTLALIGLAVFTINATHARAQEWNTNGNNISNANSGNVGIGTSPHSTVKLQVRPGTDQNFGVMGPVAMADGITLNSFNDAANANASMELRASAFNFTLGKVGIGMAPLSTTKVVIDGGALPALSITSNSQSLPPDSFISLAGNFSGGNAESNVWNGVPPGTYPNTGIRFMQKLTSSTSRDLMFLHNNGNVGIGTTSPTQALEVANGRIIATGSQTITTAGGVLEIGAIVTNNHDQASGIRMRNLFNGAANLQQGLDVAPTFAPSASILSARGSISSAFFAPPSGVTITNAYGGNAVTVYSNTTGAVTNGTGFAINSPFVLGSLKPTTQYGLHIGNQGIAGTTNTYGLYVDAQAGSANNYSAIFEGGNVGIGTTSPTAKLHVVGDGKLTGNLTIDGVISAKYQDVAEWVPASEEINAGTVVVLDSTRSNHVIPSTKGYDTRVAGVVSANPGITLGERGDSKVLVATTGRVRVRVDATRAAIRVGDLLVTSDVPGLAMKSEPISISGIELHRPGTLIGKALEPMAKGEGEILVLLSLQ